MRYLIISILVTFFLGSSQIASAGATAHTPKTAKQLTIKKGNKLKRIAKKPGADFSKIKAILSMAFGIGALLTLFLSLVLGFIYGSIGILVVGTIVSGILSGIAMVFGIDTMKNNRRSRGFGLAGIITGAIAFFGVVVMTVLFASGSLY